MWKSTSFSTSIEGNETAGKLRFGQLSKTSENVTPFTELSVTSILQRTFSIIRV